MVYKIVITFSVAKNQQDLVNSLRKLAETIETSMLLYPVYTYAEDNDGSPSTAYLQED
jgi:hypothetical protein